MSERPPAPNTCHPYYAGMQADLANWLNNTTDPYRRVVKAEPVDWRTAPDFQATFTEHTLHRRKAFGPMPFTGRPAYYLWPIGADEQGRMVAGEARRRFMESGPLVTEWSMHVIAKSQLIDEQIAALFAEQADLFRGDL